ncbi:hypothetical protein [Mobiluncus curtisii]|uniref:hypothetical protein n=1 Tax=Mobiluncus curtisii TaxID=2051 RepID=UPI0005622C00|nr:hypothetical protein [Mobiluncus curtisii]QQT12824.1 hypothetical protein I6I84_06735 [Mobiluncus curtisii]
MRRAEPGDSANKYEHGERGGQGEQGERDERGEQGERDGRDDNVKGGTSLVKKSGVSKRICGNPASWSQYPDSFKRSAIFPAWT